MASRQKAYKEGEPAGSPSRDKDSLLPEFTERVLSPDQRLVSRLDRQDLESLDRWQ